MADVAGPRPAVIICFWHLSSGIWGVALNSCFANLFEQTCLDIEERTQRRVTGMEDGRKDLGWLYIQINRHNGVWS